MKKYLLALVLGFILAFPVWAEEETEEEQVEEQTNAFGYPDTTEVAVINNEGEKKTSTTIRNKPDCNNPKLIAMAQKALQPYIYSSGRTITDKRQTKLVLKNVDNFTVLDTKNNFDAEKNRVVAARLVELKINNQITEENIKICQSDNPVLKSKLYLFIYDTEKGLNVELINFSPKIRPHFEFVDD